MKKITKTCKHCKQVVIEHHECKDGITHVRREMGPLLPFAYGPNDTIAKVVIEHHECKDGITYVRREMGPLLPFAYGPNDTIAKCEGGLTPCEWEVSE